MELFVRDHTKTSLRVVVRDARLREHDSILGIIDLPLQETLRYASRACTRCSAASDGATSCLSPGTPVEAETPASQLPSLQALKLRC